MTLRVCTLFALLLAAAVTGSLVTVLAYQSLVASMWHEVELGSERLLALQAELDELTVQILRVNHQILSRSSNGSADAPDYVAIDRVIDNPPNDTAARNLYYSLAYDTILVRENRIQYDTIV